MSEQEKNKIMDFFSEDDLQVEFIPQDDGEYEVVVNASKRCREFLGRKAEQANLSVEDYIKRCILPDSE